MDFYRIESCRGEEGRPEGEAPFWNQNVVVHMQFPNGIVCLRYATAQYNFDTNKILWYLKYFS